MTNIIGVKDRREGERRVDFRILEQFMYIVNDRRQDFSDAKGGNTKKNRQGATRRVGKERRSKRGGSIKLMHSFVYDMKKGIEEEQGYLIEEAVRGLELVINRILKPTQTTAKIQLTDNHPYRKIK